MARRPRAVAPSPAMAPAGPSIPMAGEFPTAPVANPKRGGFAGSKGKAKGTKSKGQKPAFLK
jgi:hypothetical protein